MIELPIGTPLAEMFKIAKINPKQNKDPLDALRRASGLSFAQIVAKLPPADQETVLSSMENPDDLVYDWNFWGRPNQIPPTDGWSTYALVSGRGFGKELCVDTPVPVPGEKRWKTMGTIKIGDRVFDEQGQVCTVLQAHDIRTPKHAYRMHFSDGTHIDAGADHLWVTFDGTEFEKLAKNKRGRGKNTSFHDTWANIRRQKATDWEAFLMGRGDPTSPYYKGPDWEIYARARVRDTKTLYEEVNDGVDHYIPAVIAPLQRRIRKTDKWNGIVVKHVGPLLVEGILTTVPEPFFHGTTNQLSKILRALLAAWGKRDESGHVILTIEENEALLLQVMEMLRVLGEIPIREGNTIGFYPFHRGLLFLYRESDTTPFTARKGGLESRSRKIVRIEEITPKPMRCLTVDSKNSMYLAGEAMIPTHNTRAGAEWVHRKAMENPGCRITLVGRTAADIRDVIVDGDSGILNVGRPTDRAEYLKTQRRLVWPNGSIAVGFSAEEPDQLRGWQGHYAWGDEIAAWKHTLDDSGLTAWDNMVISTRLGNTPQVLVTTTPKRNKFMFDLLEMEQTESGVIIVRGSTLENAGALGSAYIKQMLGRYEGTRLADQELYGLMLEKVEGALWNEQQINDDRFTCEKENPPKPPLVVIAVDPSVADDPTDDCGIIVAGATNHRKLEDREAWVLEDCSVNGPPSVWAQQVVDTWDKYRCPVIVETNQGGAMAATIIHALNAEVPILDVRANEGKKLRAEGVTLKYDKHLVHHVNNLPDLENEMCSWVPGETRKSPDRVDALVYAITALLIKPPKRLGEKKLRGRSSAQRRLPPRGPNGKSPGSGGPRHRR